MNAKTGDDIGAERKGELRVTQRRFNRLIAGLKLVEIYFRKASFRFSPELRHQDQPPRLSVATESSFSPLGGDAFEAVQLFTLKGRARGSGRILASITCEVVAVYETRVQMSPDLFEPFKETALLVNTWPYLREFVQSCTLRAGLPPLVLPLAKFLPPSEQ